MQSLTMAADQLWNALDASIMQTHEDFISTFSTLQDKENPFSNLLLKSTKEPSSVVDTAIAKQDPNVVEEVRAILSKVPRPLCLTVAL